MIKKYLHKLINYFNYNIRKYPSFNYDKIDIFDLVINNYISKNKDQLFYFIQVGAHNGLKNDPINKYIRQNGWKGILIEPQKNIFNELKENYKEFSKNLILKTLQFHLRKMKLNYLVLNLAIKVLQHQLGRM